MKSTIVVIQIKDLLSLNINWENHKFSGKKKYYFKQQEIILVKYSNNRYDIITSNQSFIDQLYFLKAEQKRNKYENVLTNTIVCCIIGFKEIESLISYKEFCKRYVMERRTMIEPKIKIDEINEEGMSYSDDDLYNINSWGADLSFREILTMYQDGDLLKPELQRKYVWTRNEASRFIDSILLGLPVPSIFFAKEPDSTMLIVDGYQRIMTVNDYIGGTFSGDGKVFKLANSDIINNAWRGKAFVELSPEEKRKIRTTTIHAIIFEQKYPNDDTGMYQIFERINTGGKTLKPQEIRNCVYQGNFNTLLFELNRDEQWRKILNLEKEDARMADIELILRFFAMDDIHNRVEASQKQINLSKYLNSYMGSLKNANEDILKEKRNLFINVMKVVDDRLGEAAFKNVKKNSTEFTNKLNPAIFDAVSIATSYMIKGKMQVPMINLVEKYLILLQNEKFRDASTSRTTNIENICTRISLATEILYGVKYDW